ncbi:hypothetical protein CRE_18694 [Caenorhabditis remanei]|uniref:Uncharacterized protein n=1 Tax=Caenorhabditis remanei TaxID=31234 RepID=E3LL67_CAERE|nr:hypothetical protein CRE_18694 [Caenorhabditis remanei]
MCAEPTWQGIPPRIKQDIVTSLDYRSRFRLRVCSKSEQYLVDNSPIILEGLTISWRPSGFALAVKKDGKVSEIHDNSTDKLINLFFDVFKVKRSFVKNVGVQFLLYMNEIRLEPLITRIQLMTDHDLKIRTKHASLIVHGLSNQDFTNFFQLFDSKVLESFKFENKHSQDQLKEISSFEVWKSLRQIDICRIKSVPLDSFLHMNRLKYFSSNLSSEDIWKLVSTFLKRADLLSGFGFSVTCGNNLTKNEVVSGLGEQFKSLSISLNGNQYELSQLFSTLAADLVFVVTLEFKKLQGYVCSRRTINEDFEEFSKWDNAPFAFLRSNPSN